MIKLVVPDDCFTQEEPEPYPQERERKHEENRNRGLVLPFDESPDE